VLSELCGVNPSCIDSGERDGGNSIASLCGRWMSSKCDDNEDEQANSGDIHEGEATRCLVMYVKVHNKSTEDISNSQMKAVQKLQILASLLSVSVLWVSNLSQVHVSEGKVEEATDVSDFLTEEKHDVLALDESCRRCQVHVQQEISSFRVMGATILHVCPDQKSAINQSPLIDVSGEEHYFNTDTETFTLKTGIDEAVNSEVNCVSSLKAKLLTGSPEKLKPMAEQSNAIDNSVSATLELLHMCVLAVDVLAVKCDASSTEQQESEVIKYNNDGGNDDDDDDDDELSGMDMSSNSSGSSDQVSDEVFASVARDREADSRRRCSDMLNELLVEKDIIIIGGSFEERKLTEKWKNAEGIDLETVSELMQVCFRMLL
jgi:hypothetical protein